MTSVSKGSTISLSLKMFSYPSCYIRYSRYSAHSGGIIISFIFKYEKKLKIMLPFNSLLGLLPFLHLPFLSELDRNPLSLWLNNLLPI